jgi:hypothetical protein
VTLTRALHRSGKARSLSHCSGLLLGSCQRAPSPEGTPAGGSPCWAGLRSLQQQQELWPAVLHMPGLVVRVRPRAVWLAHVHAALADVLLASSSRLPASHASLQA